MCSLHGNQTASRIQRQASILPFSANPTDSNDRVDRAFILARCVQTSHFQSFTAPKPNIHFLFLTYGHGHMFDVPPTQTHTSTSTHVQRSLTIASITANIYNNFRFLLNYQIKRQSNLAYVWCVAAAAVVASSALRVVAHRRVILCTNVWAWRNWANSIKIIIIEKISESCENGNAYESKTMKLGFCVCER